MKEGRIEERRNEGEELKVEENQKEVEIGSPTFTSKENSNL